MSNFTLKWHGDKIMNEVEEQVMLQVTKAGLDLKNKSSNQTPLKTGDLRGNCSVVSNKKIVSAAEGGKDADANKPIDAPSEDLSVNVGYSLPYALRQHEELGFSHPKGGKAKFLEDPYNENISKYKEFIADGVKKATT